MAPHCLPSSPRHAFFLALCFTAQHIIIIIIIIKIPARAFIAFLPFSCLLPIIPPGLTNPRTKKPNLPHPTLPHPALSQTHPKKIKIKNKIKIIIFPFS
jgi:hypothetical protein